jgi:hypothetical protein
MKLNKIEYYLYISETTRTMNFIIWIFTNSSSKKMISTRTYYKYFIFSFDGMIAYVCQFDPKFYHNYEPLFLVFYY